jgi:hypothetical protein
MRPYLEKTFHKKRLDGVAQGVGPEFKTQYWEKKKKIAFNYLTLKLNNTDFCPAVVPEVCGGHGRHCGMTTSQTPGAGCNISTH